MRETVYMCIHKILYTYCILYIHIYTCKLITCVYLNIYMYVRAYVCISIQHLHLREARWAGHPECGCRAVEAAEALLRFRAFGV